MKKQKKKKKKKKKKKGFVDWLVTECENWRKEGRRKRKQGSKGRERENTGEERELKDAGYSLFYSLQLLTAKR